MDLNAAEAIKVVKYKLIKVIRRYWPNDDAMVSRDMAEEVTNIQAKGLYPVTFCN